MKLERVERRAASVVPATCADSVRPTCLTSLPLLFATPVLALQILMFIIGMETIIFRAEAFSTGRRAVACGQARKR
jgi:hypothetical protein